MKIEKVLVKKVKLKYVRIGDSLRWERGDEESNYYLDKDSSLIDICDKNKSLTATKWEEISDRYEIPVNPKEGDEVFVSSYLKVYLQ